MQLQAIMVGEEGMIPMLPDQTPCAQSCHPMDMMRHGWASSLFQALQQ